MNKYSTLIFFFLFVSFSSFGQGLVNYSAYMRIQANAVITISGAANGNFKNDNTLANVNQRTVVDGDLFLTGNFTNNANFTSNTGRVTFNGTTNQTLGGTSNPIAFYNLVENNSTGLTINLANVNVTNQLTMTLGNINLNANELTLGTSTANVGTLVYTNNATAHSTGGSGWMYGTGKFSRWFNNSTIVIGTINGYFPLGSSTYYHPFWFGNSGMNFGGIISIAHDPSADGNTGISSYTDVSWGNTVTAISVASWKVSTTSTVDINGTNGSIQFGGNGFVPFNSTDVNASLVSNTVETYGVPTNVTATYFEVNRTGIQTADLYNNWYIGTRNTNQTPLPVDLLSFNGTCNEREVSLNWSTASESNNNYFTIDRSSDGNNWINIANIPGAGNSNQILNYSYADENHSAQIVYYRLQQTDFDGNIKSFTPISVSCSSNDDIEVTVSPNPFKNEISVSLQNFPYNSGQITIFDVIGNKISEQNIATIQNQKYKTTFDVSGLANGMYFIQLKSSGYSKNIKIIKN
jgi:hypothetical protein